jgi:hypothetical protein
MAQLEFSDRRDRTEEEGQIPETLSGAERKHTILATIRKQQLILRKQV